MKPATWRRDEPDSPCQNVCVIHPRARICVGCHRTAEEIREWAALSPERRRQIKRDLPGRAGQLAMRKGGRKARVKEGPEGGGVMPAPASRRHQT